MRALSVTPKQADSLRLRGDLPEPQRNRRELLVEAWLIGVCGTDREIIAGHYGAAPEGEAELVLGHESLGRVVEHDPDSRWQRGDLVVGIVRRPDPVPCRCCAAGEWDMCMNGRYTERGITGAHGYASERYTLQEAYAVRVPASLGANAILLEPASVVAKAWEQIERIATRARSLLLRDVLVTGAGPVGLLAALIGQQRGYRVRVLDRASSGAKPELVRRLGARYTTARACELDVKPEIVIECTGAEQVVADVLRANARNAVVCLAGVSSGARQVRLAASNLNDGLVLENDVVFGSVNANARHYAAAVEALTQADPAWLADIVTRSVPLMQYKDAFARRDGDIKVVLDMRA